MDQKERDAQTAVGNMKKFRVQITVPIQMTVTITKQVMAVNNDDAVEQAKTLLKIQPESVLVNDCRDQMTKNPYSVKTEWVNNSKLTFTPHEMKEPRMMSEADAGVFTNNSVEAVG